MEAVAARQPAPHVADGTPYVMPSPPRTNASTGNHQQVGDRITYDQEPELLEPPPEPQITAMGTVGSEDTIDDNPIPRDEFYGNSSAASFIKEACDSVMGVPETPNAPSSTATRHPMTARTIGATGLKCLNSASLALPSRSLADHLVERYFDRVFYLYPVFHRPSFERAYKALWEPVAPGPSRGAHAQSSDLVGLGASPNGGADSIVFHCALNAIFALGSHFSDLTGLDRDATAYTFFFRSQKYLGLDFLESETLGVVQALLIMTVFLQSTPFAGRCWNSVGIACRLAQGLGLHTDASGSRKTPIEKEIRRRVWHGCVVLDM